MAKQKNAIKLTGSMGNLTFYKNRDEYLARRKTNLDKDRITRDPTFYRTHCNSLDFGTAGKAGKALHDALRIPLSTVKDPKMVSRLTGEMVRIIHTDFSAPRGSRSVQHGHLPLLLNFEFNASCTLSSHLFAPFRPFINRSTGLAHIDFPPLYPKEDLNFPTGTTHVKLFSAIVGVDFSLENSDKASCMVSKIYTPDESAMISIDEPIASDWSLAMSFDSLEDHVLILVLGMAFFQEVNGIPYALEGLSGNSLSIVGVDHLP